MGLATKIPGMVTMKLGAKRVQDHVDVEIPDIQKPENPDYPEKVS